MRFLLVATLVVVALVGGCTSQEERDHPVPAPQAQPDAALLAHLQTLAAAPEVRFDTDHGEIRLLLYTEWMPVTTGHITALVERGFYDGLLIHRVVDDFVIQGGDPTGTGEGGSGPAGTSDMIPLEIKEGLQFGSGAVGLARWTDDTGDSQWFITEKPALHLNDPQGTTGDIFGAYALFAQVFEGMEVVRSIAAVDTIPQADRPITEVVIRSAKLLPPPADADLINLVPDVVAPFDAWGARNAKLEVPRFAVVGHPIQIRLHVAPPQDTLGNTLPCPAGVAEGNHWHHEGAEDPRPAPIFKATTDPCTFEASLQADAPGNWRFIGTDGIREGIPGEHVIHVLPWHEAYRPHAGTSAD